MKPAAGPNPGQDRGLCAWLAAGALVLCLGVTVHPRPAAGASHDPIVGAAISGKAYVLAEFVSATCPACEQMQPVVRSVVARHPGLIHQVHDADREAELAKTYEVRCVPVYVVVDPEGQVRFNDVGLFTADELEEILRGAGAGTRPARGN
jgi:thiol-disulfide isomerase/thioredoxin